MKRDREGQDRRDREAAQEDAESRKQKIEASRSQGGSRFNIRLDKEKSGQALTPQMIMAALAQYVVFPAETFGPNSSRPAEEARNDSTPTLAPQPKTGDPASSLKKGLTRAQVEVLFGPPTETHDRTQGTLVITSCTYQSATETVQADFVNGVLIQYTVSSR